MCKLQLRPFSQNERLVTICHNYITQWIMSQGMCYSAKATEPCDTQCGLRAAAFAALGAFQGVPKAEPRATTIQPQPACSQELPGNLCAREHQRSTPTGES